MRARCLAWLLVPTLAFAPASAADPPKKPFIARTHVVAPLQFGDFVLEGTRYDPANKFAGVAIRYFVPGQEATRIDLFVYPNGRSESVEALDQGMRDFRATLDAAERAGYYRNLEVADAVEFDIPLPSSLPGAPEAAPSDDATAESPEAAPAGDDTEEGGRIAMLAGLLGKDRRIDGRMIRLAYDYPGQVDGEWLPMHSRGYLFYHHLYFFKGRISAAESRIDATAFAALADRAMRELVPAVQAYNVGSCGDTSIHVDLNAPEKARMEALMRDLVAAQVRGEANNCHPDPKGADIAALSDGAEVVVIEYEPGDWNSAQPPAAR